MKDTRLITRARSISMSEVPTQPGALLTGDAAVAYSNLPIDIIRAKADIANKTGTYTADRIGNKPLIGNYSYKPMSVKTKTGAAFLFKSLIPLNADYLKAKSVEVSQKNIDRYQTSQLKVSLNDILSDQNSYKIEHKDGKLYLHPIESKINADDFKNPGNVSSTVFIIDLQSGEKPSLSPEEKQKRLPGTQIPQFTKPAWWKDEYGDFKEAQHLLRPVEYQNSTMSQPQKFEVLGNPPMTGDIDSFWIVPAATSFINNDKSGLFESAHEKLDFNDIKDVRKFRKTFNNIVNAMNKEIHGKETQVEFTEKEIQALDIEGYATPFEAATIYMINKLYGEKQMMLHGPESHNPGTPSEIGEILHILPGGRIYLTRNEDELIKLALTENFLRNYPIPIHPGWDMSKDKWGQVVEGRMTIEKDMREKGITIKQPLNPETIKAYQKVTELEKNAGNPEEKDKKPSILSTFVNRFKRSSSDAPQPPSAATLKRNTSHTNMLNLLSPRSEGEKVDDYKARLQRQIKSSEAQTQSGKQQTTSAQSEQSAEQKSVAISPRSSSIKTAKSSSSTVAAATEPETEEKSSPNLGGRK